MWYFQGMKPETKKEQILRVAEETFADKGFKGATMREIAEKVNIQTPGLYYHFKNKDDIYNSLILEIYRELWIKVLEPVKQMQGIEQKIRLLVNRLIDFWAEHPKFPRIIALEVLHGSELIDDELVPNFLKPMFNDMVSTLEEEEVREEGIRDIDVPVLVFNVFGISMFYFFSGNILTKLTGEDSFSPERIAKLKDEVLTMVFDGIASHPAGIAGPI